MRSYAYENYKGDGNYLYLCAAKDDESPVYLAEKLAEESVNLIFDEVGKTDPREMAEKIAGASACLFFFSEEAVTSVAFRNRVNHAVACEKKIVSLRPTYISLAHGMEMQLANDPTLTYAGPEWTIHQLQEMGFLTEEVRGERPKEAYRGSTKALLAVVIAAAIFVAALNIYWKKQEEKTIAYYAGETLEELDLSNAGLTSLSGIENVIVKDLDISGNPAITDFSLLLSENGPETVRISQDMLKFGHLLKDRVRLVITK